MYVAHCIIPLVSNLTTVEPSVASVVVPNDELADESVEI
jgi:hypothetical protein